MTPEQEIRAHAAQAAAAYCGPMQGDFENVVCVTRFFETLIAEGCDAAIELHTPSQPPAVEQGEPRNSVEDVELREQQAPAIPEGAVSFDPDPVTVARVAELPARSAPAPEGASPEGEDSMSAAIGTVSPIRSEARRKIDKVKRERAGRIVAVAHTAKAPEDKARLCDEAESAGLLGFRMEIDGRLQTVGAYLQSL